MILDSCDSLERWSITNGVLTLDTVNYVEGIASVMGTANAGVWATYIRFLVPYGAWLDLRNNPILRVRFRPSNIDGSRNVRFSLITNENGNWVGYGYGVLSLQQGIWNTVEIDLRTPLPEYPAPDLSTVWGIAIMYTTSTVGTPSINVDYVEANPVTPPPTYRLSVLTPETGAIPFTFDGSLLTSNLGYDRLGGTYTITMPTQVSAAGRIWNFSRWEDTGSTNPVRTISLTSNLILTARYVEYVPPPPTHTVNIISRPSGILFTVITLGGERMSYTSPWTGNLTEESWTFELPPAIDIGYGVILNFVSWEDGSTNPTRTIVPTAPMTLEATYEGRIEAYAYANGTRVSASGRIIETGQTFVIPSTGLGIVQLPPRTYTLEATYMEQVLTQQVTVVAGQIVRADFIFVAPPPVPIDTAVGWNWSPKPAIAGENVVIWSTLVALPDYTGIVGRTVEFRLNGTVLGSGVTDDSGTASITVIAPSPGDYTLTVNFAGDEFYNPSTNSAIFSVEAPPPPPLGKGYLQINATYQGQPVSATGSVNGIAIDYTPITLELDPGIYTISLTYAGETQTKTASVLEGQTIRVDVEITPISPLKRAVPILAPLGIGTVLYWLSQKK